MWKTRYFSFFFPSMEKRPTRQAASDQTDNYFKIPAKPLTSNGSVKTPKRRKSNGFGSQSMATKTELIEVQQKLEDSELRIANLEAELEEKLIESNLLQMVDLG